MEAVVPIFGTVKCLSVPVIRRIGYAKNLKNNFEKLNKLSKELYDKRDDLNSMVNTASPAKAPTCLLQTWFKEVKEIEDQVNAIVVTYKQEKKCFGGWCPDISQRFKLSMQMVELINNISVLKEKINSDSIVIVDAPPSAVEWVPTSTIEPGNSAERALQNIMAHIRNASVGKIGVCGMGGIGKTTMMQKLNNLPEIEQMFDIVIWVTVSRDWNLRRVQNEVARRLKLTLSNDMSNDEVSRSLYHRLGNSRYLLLLDDVWNKVNLEEVGIPIPNEKNKCKIVLTTRSRKVCKEMETDGVIHVKLLSEVEAWYLFCTKVGSVVASPEIKPLARSILKECEGLPLAVIVVGGALREEDDVHVWRNALKELSSASTSQIQDMEEVVFKRLKFSYDRLKFDRQRCFLYGALFPEDYPIPASQLIQYWRAAGFLEGVESLAEAVDKGHAIMRDLVDASLFQKRQIVFGDDRRVIEKYFVKIHDLIRDLALWITSLNNNKFLVKAGVELKDPLRDTEKWKEYTAISLMDNKLQWLPEQVQCPILLTLLLSSNVELHAIPDSFFESMVALRVLDLSRTHIKSLPPSICNLISLRELYLNYCHDLIELSPGIGALNELEVLQLKGVKKNHNILIEVGELTRLTSLHISMIPHGIFSRLSLLEELSINENNCDPRRNRNLEDVVKDIGELKRLSRLDLCFKRVEYLKCFLSMSEPWKKGTLSSFYFGLGGSYLTGVVEDGSRYFRFVEGADVPNTVMEVLSSANGFRLEDHGSIKKLGEFGAENMTHLKELYCSRCFEMGSLLDINCSLPSLQKMELFEMPKLRNIWGDEQQSCQLPANLRILTIMECPSLPEVLFSPSVILQLHNLEKLTVSSSKGVQKIIGGGNDVEYNALPKLGNMILSDLRNLVSISKKPLAFSSLHYIAIVGCANLKRLRFTIHNASTLRRIECDKAWWESLHWENNEIKKQLQTSVTYRTVIV